MEKIINVRVSGSEIEQSSAWGGVQGEGGTRCLKISFDEEWGALSKTVTFLDAYLSNPVKVLLTTTNLNEDGTYTVSIPAEPLITGVKFTYVIEGSTEGVLQKSVQKELKVKDAPIIDPSFLPSTVTPSQADQLNLSIHKEATRIDELELKSATFEDNIANLEESVSTELSKKADQTEVEQLQGQIDSCLNQAKEYVEEAEEHSKNTQNVYEKTVLTSNKYPYIGDNGNWFVWDTDAECYVDSGQKSQGLGVDNFYSEFIGDTLLLKGGFISEIQSDVLYIRGN